MQVQLLYELTDTMHRVWQKLQKQGGSTATLPEAVSGPLPGSPVRSSVGTAPPDTSTCSPSAEVGTTTEVREYAHKFLFNQDLLDSHSHSCSRSRQHWGGASSAPVHGVCCVICPNFVQSCDLSWLCLVLTMCLVLTVLFWLCVLSCFVLTMWSVLTVCSVLLGVHLDYSVLTVCSVLTVLSWLYDLSWLFCPDCACMTVWSVLSLSS